MELDFESDIAVIEDKIEELTSLGADSNGQFDAELAKLGRERIAALKKTYADLSPWQTVQVARHPNRPVFQDYVAGILDEFIELHGDRCFGDDPAMLGGFATIGDHRVMLIGMAKGKGIEEKVHHNFGMANPEGYRKALRLMHLAEKFGLPVVCLVDTPAAYPGREAEERGQAEAIARNLTEMATLETPIVVVVTGEGGSGGALGIGVGDVVLMLKYAIYSVIPPEGCAAILWRDAARAPEAAEALKLTAPSLLDLGIIDAIIPEPTGGAHRFPQEALTATREAIVDGLRSLKRFSRKRLVERRLDKYVKIGKFDNRKYSSH